MRLGWLVLIGLTPLAACGSSKAQDMADCQMKAVAIYPHWRDQPAPSAEEATDYIANCMRVKGYVPASTDSSCTTAIEWLTRQNEICYRKPWPWES
jgi:hypothetical protein